MRRCCIRKAAQVAATRRPSEVISTAALTPSHCITTSDSPSAPNTEPKVDQARASPPASPTRALPRMLESTGTVCARK